MQSFTVHYILQHTCFRMSFNSSKACETECNSLVNMYIILSMTKVIRQKMFIFQK